MGDTQASASVTQAYCATACHTLLAEVEHLRQHSAMKKFIIRIGVNAVALWVAALVLGDRIEFNGHGWQLVQTILLVALIFGLVNTFIKPIVDLLTFPFKLLTLGLFAFVINALMLLLTSKISEHFAVQFHVANFVSALLGSLVITVVTVVVHAVLPSTKK
jgi:putative membrane protein